MRNLKRAFSLVLALVMVLSVVTIAPVAAAETAPATVTSNFSDAAEINYTEAVAITGGIGLFAGADGKFMPKGTVTRAQMATIIVKMLYGGDVNADGFKGNGKFSDTANFEGGWAEGYINWCSTLGVVAGYGDGTFKPGNQVTTAEAATMILNALKIDAGEGTWPNTVMAKAEEEDFFEDLKPMPGTNTALTREELAVIALNGLYWTPTDETGWYVSGVNADSKMTFESYKDAQKYADKVGGEVQPLEGRDSLANKVYDLKKYSGFVTANQATGEKYTEVTADFTADPVAKAKFNVETGANMIGHKVEVWYEETYTSEKEPGKTYAVSEAAEYITLNEKVENTKEYKAAFGTKYDLPDGGVVATSGTGYVTAGQTITGYVANTSAPTGTYVIDNESGKLCGYIAPATYTVAKVSFVDTTADSEQIILSNGDTLKNTAEEDEVVEYDGIAKDHYVAYYQVQGVCVLTKLEPVVGTVTKIGENKESKKVITLNNGTQYIQSSATGTIPNTLGVTDLEGFDNYDQTYTFYLDPAGNFVCFEAVEGGNFDMANTFYVLGVMSRDETDSYGKTSTWYFARGVDMAGNEAMVPVGMQKAGGSLIGADELSDFDDEENAAYNFVSVEDNTDSKETEEYGLKKLIGFPSAYNEDDPTAPYCFEVTSYGATGEDWEEGGKFQYGMANQFNGNGGLELGVYCSNHKNTKYIVVEGTADQDYPLESAVYTGTATIKFAKNVPFRVLVTRQANGTNSIEAIAFPMPVDQSLNATMVYVDKYHTTPAGTTATGNVYEVHDGITGEAMEITLSSEIDEIPVGFYSVGYDADEEIYKLAVEEVGGKKVPISVPAAETEDKGFPFETRDRNDGRYHESVVYGITPTAYNGSTLWFKGPNDSIWSSVCSGVKVVDPRTDEQVAEDGVARITSMDQIWALKNSMPWVAIELDLCHTYSPSKVATAFVEVYNNREYGIGNLVYADTYNDTKVIVVDGELDGMGKIVNLPDGVVAREPGFYRLSANGENVMLSAAELDTVSKVALNGNVSGLNGYKIFNATDIPALNTLAGFADYVAVEYQLLPLEEKGITVLLVMGAGEKVASGNTAKKAVDSNEYDSVVDTVDAGITLKNLEAKQGTLCIAYDAYKLNGDRMLMVVTGTAEGTTVNTMTALQAIDNATVTNNTDAKFGTLAELESLIGSGYAFSAKLYDLHGGKVLVVSVCMNAASVDGALSKGSFASDKVVLSGPSTLSGTITVPAGEKWLLDLSGNTLSGSVAPYFIISAGAELTIQDSGNGGKVRGTQGADAMFKVEGDLILNGGELCDHENTNANARGGAIVLSKKDATFTMNGGVIRNNKSAGRGGAIGTQDSLGGSTITINGGEIVDNIADRGNNIYTQSTVTFIMTGGTIGQGKELDGTVATEENMWMRNTTIEISGASKIIGLGPDSTCTMKLAKLADGAYIEMTRTDAVVTKDETVSQSGTVYTNSAAAGGGLNFKVVQPANGTIALSPASAELDDTVTVTATPNTGYELKAIYVDGKAIEGTSFVVKKAHRVTAEFVLKSYDIDVKVVGDGTASANVSTATMGETITITATPNTEAGMELNYIKVNGVALADGVSSFAMPTEDVTVEVKFGAHPYEIDIASNANGTIKVDATGNKATAGTNVTITVTPKSGYAVTGLTVTGATPALSGTPSVTAVHTYTFTMPAADVAVTASFVQGVSVVRADEADLPADCEVEANDFVTTENIKEKLADNDINFTVFGNVVVIDSFSAGKSVPLTQTTGEVAAGKYYLTGNLPLTGILQVKSGATVTIDLAGYEIHAKDGTNGVFNVLGELTVLDSSAEKTGKIVSHGVGNPGSTPAVNITSGSFTLDGGEITGWVREGGAGGMVYVPDGATFNMNGGKLTGASALNGSAIRNAGTVYMNGGEISGNIASGGAAVQVEASGVFEMTKGTIKNNSGTDGGAIWNKGTVTISGGTISGNDAKEGGAIWNRAATAKLTISGGTITGNTATDRGGAIYNREAALAISGGAVIDDLYIHSATSKTIGNLKSGASVTTSANDALDILENDTTVAHTTGTKVYSYNG